MSERLSFYALLAIQRFNGSTINYSSFWELSTTLQLGSRLRENLEDNISLTNYTKKRHFVCMKRTNVVLDEKLINEGLEITGLKTQKALIDRALRDLVRRGRQKNMLRHEGKVRWEGDLNEMREMR